LLELVLAARRAAPGKRWSASQSVELYDAEGIKQPDDAAGPAKLIVRWRCDKTQRHATFTGANVAADVAAFVRTLEIAYELDWPADPDGRPIVPTGSEPARPVVA
jgi:hypothetical protein